MHTFFIALMVLVGVLVAWFAALTVSKLYKGQN
jgi:hypothetical protein